MRKHKGLVIGIIAQAGHGKDTCAAFLREEFGFSRQALADELKKDIAEMFPNFPECSIEAQNSRNRAPWVRRLQQVYGTEWCRKRLGEDYWLRRWAQAAEQLFEVGARGVLVPDIRFPNELDYLREHGSAVIFYVDRPGHSEPGVDPFHDSERFVPTLRGRTDKIIVNDGGLDVLRSRVVVGMSELLAGEGLPPRPI